MKNLKVLNLYAGGGGNRKLWDNVDVVAIEYDEKIAECYQRFFPDDEVIITDAHEFLLENYQDYDFIWSSPPCPTHSVVNNYLHYQGTRRYPDMRLYQEIIYLQKFHKGSFCVENVKSYYEPLIKPQVFHRHYFWANFYITPFNVPHDFNIGNIRTDTRLPKKEYMEKLEELHGVQIPDDVPNKGLILRNMVYPPLGKHILDCARGIIQQKLFVRQNSK